MRVLGIDVGFAICGWSIVDKVDGKIKLVDFGVIESDKSLDIPERLEIIYTGVRDIIKLFKPTDIAVEDIFFSNNAKTVINVSQVRGVILLGAYQDNLKIYKYTPPQVKMAVTGYGRAEKKQIQEMVQRIFKLSQIPKPDDAADAVAIAYCHINNTKYD
jgi:crossover junction endodeoxyribonuclease RuvC